MITSTFDKALEKAVIEGIEQVTFYGGSTTFVGWNSRNTRVLNVLIKEGVVTQEKLLGTIHTLLKKTGRNCYNQHMRGEYPDHTSSPQAFAYALKHDEFTQKEERRIQFDHGETKLSFIEHYAGNIQQSIFNQLTTEKEDSAKMLTVATDECFDCHH